jgi:hypothetical protein
MRAPLTSSSAPRLTHHGSPIRHRKRVDTTQENVNSLSAVEKTRCMCSFQRLGASQFGMGERTSADMRVGQCSSGAGTAAYSSARCACASWSARMLYDITRTMPPPPRAAGAAAVPSTHCTMPKRERVRVELPCAAAAASKTKRDAHNSSPVSSLVWRASFPTQRVTYTTVTLSLSPLSVSTLTLS